MKTPVIAQKFPAVQKTEQRRLLVVLRKIEAAAVL
jgi:hypothetical protein